MDNECTKKITDCIDELSQLAEQYFKDHSQPINQEMLKKETHFVDYQNKESKINRVLYYDRSHPVDSVIINEFNRKTGANLEEVKMIYGPASDEYTRSNHALAVTAMGKIFFRNGAYKPETEEGRKLLTHELTHIAQLKERNRIINKERYEIEAEKNEQLEEYSTDPYEIVCYNNKKYRIRASVKREIERRKKQNLEKLIEQQENFLSEDEYLKLLIKYENYIEK